MRHDFNKILEKCEPLLQHYEGFRGKAYDDADGVTVPAPTGRLTIGYGRNIQDRPLTKIEAAYLLRGDIAVSILEAASLTISFEGLSLARKIVLTCMVYQMGYDGVKRFKNMLKCIEDGDFTGAATEMLDSKWYREDSPKRALDMSLIMENGVL